MTMGIQQLMWRIERVKDDFHEALWSAGDVEAALAATGGDCTLVNLPVQTGAAGDELRCFLAEDVIPHRPADLIFRRVSRTVDQRRVVDEASVEFTHDRELPWLLPGVPPTCRRAEVLAVSVVTFRHRTQLGTMESRIVAHRTLWDHSGLLAQLDLDPSAARTGGYPCQLGRAGHG
jgi:carboxymethylenebutenolidase